MDPGLAGEECEMRRAVVVFLIGWFVVGAGLPCGKPGFRVTEKGVMVWTPPSGDWEVAGCRPWVGVDFSALLEKRPPGLEVLKMYERIVYEKGEWLNFAIKFCAVQKVVFTKATKIVLVDRSGRRIESETICFRKDLAQTEVYDASERPVVVTSKSVRSVKDCGRPFGAVKFPAGSFRYEDIVGFEVVGAVEDTAYRETE
jgi:hypothetical protein